MGNTGEATRSAHSGIDGSVCWYLRPPLVLAEKEEKLMSAEGCLDRSRLDVKRFSVFLVPNPAFLGCIRLLYKPLQRAL